MPLTTSGITVQILSSLRALRDHPEHCTVNDCKVVVNHLIRKFSEPLQREGVNQEMQSMAVAAGNNGDTVRDHAVPVIVLVEQLLEWPNQDLDVSAQNIDRLGAFLRENLLIVEVTREENRILSRQGFQSDMPNGWSTEGHPLYRDPLARYRECRIDVLTIPLRGTV